MSEQDELRLEKFKSLLGELFEVLRIEAVNYKVNGAPGHPFMIGAQHVAFASDKRGGILSPDAIDASGIGCQYMEGSGYGRTKCGQPWSAHTSDKAMFIKLKRNLTNREAALLLEQAKPLMAEYGIDGWALVDTPEKFRIAPSEETDGQEETGEPSPDAS